MKTGPFLVGVLVDFLRRDTDCWNSRTTSERTDPPDGSPKGSGERWSPSGQAWIMEKRESRGEPFALVLLQVLKLS